MSDEITEFTIGGLAIKLFRGDDVTGIIEKTGTFEPESLGEWLKFGSGIVIDIGAYSGVYSITAALLGRKVIAFEPQPVMANRLARNCLLNKAYVELHGDAVSDSAGTGKLWMKPNQPFSSGASLLVKNEFFLEVSKVTLDSVMAPLKGKITAIKIDVEGHEPEVLRGAAETIKRHKPIIITECTTDKRLPAQEKTLPGYSIIKKMDGRNFLWAPT